jgi:hypothetical protein
MSTSLPATTAISETGRARPIAGTLIAIALAGLGFLLDARASAELLTGSEAPLADSVTSGMWIFKALLVVHGGMVLAATRLRPRGSGARLLHGAAADETPVRGAAWMIAGMVVVGSALRLYALGEGLWFDEITTLVNYARVPVPQILSTFDSQNQHLLFSLTAHGAMAAFGDGAWALRLPAALFGIGSLWATYWLGTLVASRREGLLAAALLTASYHHVWFSQNARGYTGLLFFTLLSTALLVRLLRSDRANGWRPVVAYAVVAALGVYTHTSAVFVTVGHFIVWTVLALRASRRSDPLGWPAWLPMVAFVLAGTITLQLYAPVLPQLLSTATEPTMGGVQTDWKDPVWFVREALQIMAQGIPGGLVTVGAAMAIGVTGVVSYLRRTPGVLALMLVPAILTAGVLLLTEHNLWPRLFFFCAGFAALLAVRGVMALAGVALGSRGPVVATVLLALGAIASLTTVPRAWNPKQDFDGARQFVESRRTAGDAVVMLDLTRFPYEQYLNTGWAFAEDEAALAAIEEQHARTWVVYTFPARLSATQPELWQHIQRTYNRAARFGGTVGGGAVIVMVRE